MNLLCVCGAGFSGTLKCALSEIEQIICVEVGRTNNILFWLHFQVTSSLTWSCKCVLDSARMTGKGTDCALCKALELLQEMLQVRVDVFCSLRSQQFYRLIHL